MRIQNNEKSNTVTNFSYENLNQVSQTQGH